MKVKTSELIDLALDYAVAKAKGDELAALIIQFPEQAKNYPKWSPSTDWAQGGPIKTRELIATNPRLLSSGYGCPERKWVWQAHLLGPNNLENNRAQEHESELVAAMRCFVASRTGEEIDVPDELLT